MRGLLLSICFLISIAEAQELAYSDQSTAKEIKLNKTYTFNKSPKGFGRLQEFKKETYRSSNYFEEERNSVWFTITIPVSGIFEFEITPHSLDDDYDWMLFSGNIKSSTNWKTGYPPLIRSNNSRNSQLLKGKTGIRCNYSSSFEPPGPGRSYSKALNVKAGEKLYLIIDNIYEGGRGFDFSSTLLLNKDETRLYQGKVYDAITKEALAGARVICEDDSSGTALSTCLTDKNGAFALKLPISRNLNITASSEGYLFSVQDVLLNGAPDPQIFLKKVEPGSLSLFNIHFAPDRHLIRSNSEPELERLIDLLRYSQDYDVKIIGHTNSNPFADARYLQRLSFNRALAVQSYLVKHGISEKRISSFGVGGKRPLVVTKDAEEGLRNLRVEVVLSGR